VQFAGAPEDRFYGVEAIMKDGLGNWFSMTQPKAWQGLTIEAANLAEDVVEPIRILPGVVHEAAHGLADVRKPVLGGHFLEELQFFRFEVNRLRGKIFHRGSRS
jgi:hypothetical protein